VDSFELLLFLFYFFIFFWNLCLHYQVVDGGGAVFFELLQREKRGIVRRKVR